MNFSHFVGPSYQSPASHADVEDTINLYTETVEGAGATARRILCQIPGYVTFASTSLSPIRATFGQDGRAFAVIGYGFFEVSSAGVLTNRGTIANDGLPATISSSGDAGDQLGIVSGGSWYNFNLLTNALTVVASAGTGLIQGSYLDGYFLALDNTSTVRISNLLDGTTWDALQIAQRNDAPDRWKALIVIGKYVWLFGSETSTVLYDSGAFPFPFSLMPGVLINRGIGAVFSVVDMDGAAVWLSQSRSGARVVVRANGLGVPDRVSNHAVEAALQSYSTVSDAVAWSYAYQGHWFYQINFPTANVSWCWDATTGEWFKPLFWNAPLAQWDCSRAQYHCYAFETHLVGDRATGTIYALSGTTYTDAGGAALRRVRRCPFPRLLKSSDYVFLTQVQILMDVGIGLSTGQGSDPQVMIRISRDAGKTWGPERWESAGALGTYLARVQINRCGRFRDGNGVLEISMSDPVPMRIIGAEFTASRGSS